MGKARRVASGFGRWVLPPVVVLAAGVMALSATWIINLAGDDIYDVDTAPRADIAIVMGAQTSGDLPLPFLRGRLDTAAELYETGRVASILVTGDRRSSTGDEVTVMHEYLVAHGIPSAAITIDGDSPTTRASCQRAVDVFGIKRALVVSQAYHLPRAVALCKHANMQAFGVRANCECTRYGIVKNTAREWLLAYPKAALELLRDWH